MTEQKITMTMEQVEQEMEEYRRIFDVVRLIEEETIQMMEEGREEEVDPEKVACYSFWKKNRQCKNCISARVLREKNQGTKLEFVGEDIYQVNCLLYGNRWKSICNGTGEKTERRIPSGRRGM